MALRNLPDGKRLGDRLRALEDISRRADSLGAEVQANGATASDIPTDPDESTNGEDADFKRVTTPTVLEVSLQLKADSVVTPATQTPGADAGDSKTEANAKARDPFLDSLDALRRTLRNQSARKPGSQSDPTTVASPVSKFTATEQTQSDSTVLTPVDFETPALSDNGDASISALENMPLPEVERAPTPLPRAEEQSQSKHRRTPAPLTPDDAPKSLDNALEAVRESVGLQKPENGRPRTPSTPRPHKKRPLSDGIPKSVSEDLPKFRGRPRMRICNRCGHETKLRDPECKNCGKIDESLGILDAVISGDLSKVEQILLVRPHLISVQTNRHAWTLLHMAASGGNKKMTELLIAKGAAVNATNRDGKTPLHYAAGKGHLNVVETLLAHFADPEAKYNGKTAADLAREHSQFEVEAYLSKLAKPATD